MLLIPDFDAYQFCEYLQMVIWGRVSFFLIFTNVGLLLISLDRRDSLELR